MSTNGNDEVVPQSFRLAVQQLINDCGRHLNSSSAHVLTISVDALLNCLETTLNIIEEGINLLSSSSLFSAENALLSTFNFCALKIGSIFVFWIYRLCNNFETNGAP